jgi:RNA polymerase sigma factor (sigma-70 family)
LPVQENLRTWWENCEHALVNIATQRYRVSDSLARDIVQEVAIIALTKLPTSVDNEQKFYKWAKIVLYRRFIDWLRKSRRKAPLDEINELSIKPNQEAALFYRETLELVQKLPEKQKAVMMQLLEGKTTLTIAKNLKMSPKTVRSNLRHARTRLSELI